MVDFEEIFRRRTTEVKIRMGIFSRAEARKAPESVPSRDCEELENRFICSSLKYLGF